MLCYIFPFTLNLPGSGVNIFLGNLINLIKFTSCRRGKAPAVHAKGIYVILSTKPTVVMLSKAKDLIRAPLAIPGAKPDLPGENEPGEPSPWPIQRNILSS